MSNMYENVVTWNPLCGECAHNCSYCYMHTMRKRYNNPKWIGEPRIDEKTLNEFHPKRGSTVFVQSINDLWAGNVPDEMIARILDKANSLREKVDVQFLFQSRNTFRIKEWSADCFRKSGPYFPKGSIIGTTIETDNAKLAQGPEFHTPFNRARYLSWVYPEYERFVTVEPIMKFDLVEFMKLIREAHPHRVYIGAESKGGSSFPEPTADEVLALIRELESRGIQVIQKSNLARILKGAK